MSNELDIFVSQAFKEKVWNFQYIDLSLLSRNNFNVPNESQNCIAVEEGKLVVQTTTKPIRTKRIDTIEMWTDAFLNYAKIIIDRHPQMAKDLLTYMVTIRGATLDATFDRVYMYDQQFRLRVAQDPTRSWSQIDGVLWLRFITGRGIYGTPILNSINNNKPCYDYNFRKQCTRINCLYKHNCIKCNGSHPAALCAYFARLNFGPFQQPSVRKSLPRNYTHQQPRFNINMRPPLPH